VENILERGTKDNNMVHVHSMLDSEGYKYLLLVHCNNDYASMLQYTYVASLVNVCYVLYPDSHVITYFSSNYFFFFLVCRC